MLNLTNTNRFRARHGLFLATLVVLIAGAVAGGAWSVVATKAAATATRSRSDQLRQAFTGRLIELGQRDLAPASTSAFTTIRASVGNQQWALSTYRDNAGERCLVEQHPGGSRAYGCRSEAALFAGGPLFAQWGSAQDSVASHSAGVWDEASSAAEGKRFLAAPSVQRDVAQRHGEGQQTVPGVEARVRRRRSSPRNFAGPQPEAAYGFAEGRYTFEFNPVPTGAIDVNGQPGAWIGQMRLGGVFFTLRADDREVLLTAARTLAR